MEIAAFNARNALKSVNRNLEKSPLKLATGLRINEVADDPAGFAIAKRLIVGRGCLATAFDNDNSFLLFFHFHKDIDHFGLYLKHGAETLAFLAFHEDILHREEFFRIFQSKLARQSMIYFVDNKLA